MSFTVSISSVPRVPIHSTTMPTHRSATASWHISQWSARKRRDGKRMITAMTSTFPAIMNVDVSAVTMKPHDSLLRQTLDESPSPAAADWKEEFTMAVVVLLPAPWPSVVARRYTSAAVVVVRFIPEFTKGGVEVTNHCISRVRTREAFTWACLWRFPALLTLVCVWEPLFWFITVFFLMSPFLYLFLCSV